MEEHFRKSLGADYSKLFKEKKEEKVEKEEEEEKMEVDPVKAFKDDLDMSGYTGISDSFHHPSSYYFALVTYPLFFQLRITLRKPLVRRGPSCRRRRRRRRRRRAHRATIPKNPSRNCSHSRLWCCGRNLQR